MPGIGWSDVANNWLYALLGNLAGALVFVAGAYWYLYGRRTGAAVAPATEPTGEPAVAPAIA